jgi:hypothetical protein
MRRVSKKRAQLNKVAKEWRCQFQLELGVCEWCRKRRPIIHEIARGTANRRKAFITRFATLGLCDPGCHQEVGSWHPAKQLALLKLRRPEDYSLTAYHQLISRHWPYEEEVQAFYDQLKSGSCTS